MSETTVRYQVYTTSPFNNEEYDEPKLFLKLTGNTGAIDAQLLMDSINTQLALGREDSYEIKDMPEDVLTPGGES